MAQMTQQLHGNHRHHSMLHMCRVKADQARHAFVAGAPSTSAADLETAAINVYKRLKSTRTPLQTTRQAGKALLDASQLCGVELVRTLLGDMPDAQALEAAAQSMKQQLEECPCEGDTEDPV